MYSGVLQSYIHTRAKLLQLRLTLCDPMDCSPPGFSVYGIFQAQILEQVAIISLSRWSSRPRDRTWVSCLGRQILYGCIAWEAFIGCHKILSIVLWLYVQQVLVGYLFYIQMRWLGSITSSTEMNLSKLQEIVEDRGAWCAAVYVLQRFRHDLGTEQGTLWKIYWIKLIIVNIVKANSYYMPHTFVRALDELTYLILKINLGGR